MSAGTLISILATGWSIALLLAAWWAWGSVRSWWFSRGGKRAGTRYCRACSFDLTGLTRDDTTAATRCPECGAEIDRAGTVLIGRAVTQWPKLKWAALAVALVTTLVFAALTVSRPPALWMHRMPDWVLVRTAKVGTDADAELALRELSKRWGFVSWMPTPWRVASLVGLNYPADAMPIGGKQPPNTAAVEELAREALERQSDRSRPWVPAWGQVIESAIALNLLDDQQRARYQDNWINLTMTSRPKIRVGTKLPVSFAVTDVRTPRKVNLFMADEDLVPRSPSPVVSGTSISYGVNPGNKSLMELSGAERLPIGVHDIEIEADVAVSDKEVGRDQAKPRRWKAKVEVVASNQPISEMVRDASLDTLIRSGITVQCIDITLMPDGQRSPGSHEAMRVPLVQVTIWCRVDGRFPIPVAAHVDVRDIEDHAGDGFSLGIIDFGSGGPDWASASITMFADALPGALRRGNATVRLIGSSSVADLLPRAGPAWGSTLELSRVPIASDGIPGIEDRPWPPSRD